MSVWPCEEKCQIHRLLSVEGERDTFRSRAEAAEARAEAAETRHQCAEAVVRLLYEMADTEGCEHGTVFDHAEAIWGDLQVRALDLALAPTREETTDGG